MRTSEIGILSVGAGDTKLSFDPKNPAEREHAARVVADMLKRGYAILVQVGERDGEPLYQRAKGFDEKTCEYLIVGTPPVDVEQAPSALTRLKKTVDAMRRKRKSTPKMETARVPAETTRAVSVARSAGG